MSRSLLMRRRIRFRAWASFIRRRSPGLKYTECFLISLMIASCCTRRLNRRSADSRFSPSSRMTNAKNVHLQSRKILDSYTGSAPRSQAWNPNSRRVLSRQCLRKGPRGWPPLQSASCAKPHMTFRPYPFRPFPSQGGGRIVPVLNHHSSHSEKFLRPGNIRV